MASPNQRLAKGEVACAGCGESFRPTAAGGRTERCPHCYDWFYRQTVDNGPGAGERCNTCSGPRDATGACWICGQQHTGLWHRARRALVRWCWRLLGAPAQLDSLPIDAIELDNATLRLSLDVTRFEGLRRSIAEHGVLVPLLVRRSRKRHRLQVVSGYRRLLAARHLGLAAVPVRVVDLTDDEALAVRLADNIHRDELIDVEIAEHFERVFLGQDDKRDAVRNALGFDDEQIDSILETLQAPGEVRERMIYGVPELATAAQSPEGGRR